MSRKLLFAVFAFLLISAGTAISYWSSLYGIQELADQTSVDLGLLSPPDLKLQILLFFMPVLMILLGLLCFVAVIISEPSKAIEEGKARITDWISVIIAVVTLIITACISILALQEAVEANKIAKRANQPLLDAIHCVTSTPLYYSQDAFILNSDYWRSALDYYHKRTAPPSSSSFMPTDSTFIPKSQTAVAGIKPALVLATWRLLQSSYVNSPSKAFDSPSYVPPSEPGVYYLWLEIRNRGKGAAKNIQFLSLETVPPDSLVSIPEVSNVSGDNWNTKDLPGDLSPGQSYLILVRVFKGVDQQSGELITDPDTDQPIDPLQFLANYTSFKYFHLENLRYEDEFLEPYAQSLDSKPAASCSGYY